jgi:DNA repair exonuclease SbcCD ATPase subunit
MSAPWSKVDQGPSHFEHTYMTKVSEAEETLANIVGLLIRRQTGSHSSDRDWLASVVRALKFEIRQDEGSSAMVELKRLKSGLLQSNFAKSWLTKFAYFVSKVGALKHCRMIPASNEPLLSQIKQMIVSSFRLLEAANQTLKSDSLLSSLQQIDSRYAALANTSSIEDLLQVLEQLTKLEEEVLSHEVGLIEWMREQLSRHFMRLMTAYVSLADKSMPMSKELFQLHENSLATRSVRERFEDIEHMTEQLERCSTVLTDKISENQMLKTTVSEQLGRIDELQRNLAEMATTLSKTQEQIVKLIEDKEHSSRRELGEHLGTIEAKLDQINQRNTAKDQTQFASEPQSNSASWSSSEGIDQIIHFKQQISELKNQLSVKDHQIKEEQFRALSAERGLFERDLLAKTIEIYKERITEVEANAIESRAMIGSLRTKLQSLKDKASRKETLLKAEVERLNLEVQMMREESAKHQETLALNRNKLQQVKLLKNELASVKSSLESTTGQNQSLKQELADQAAHLYAEIEELRKSLAQKDGDFIELAIKHAACPQLTDSEIQIDQLKEKIVIKDQEIDELTTQHKACSATALTLTSGFETQLRELNEKLSLSEKCQVSLIADLKKCFTNFKQILELFVDNIVDFDTRDQLKSDINQLNIDYSSELRDLMNYSVKLPELYYTLLEGLSEAKQTHTSTEQAKLDQEAFSELAAEIVSLKEKLKVVESQRMHPDSSFVSMSPRTPSKSMNLDSSAYSEASNVFTLNRLENEIVAYEHKVRVLESKDRESSDKIHALELDLESLQYKVATYQAKLTTLHRTVKVNMGSDPESKKLYFFNWLDHKYNEYRSDAHAQCFVKLKYFNRRQNCSFYESTPTEVTEESKQSTNSSFFTETHETVVDTQGETRTVITRVVKKSTIQGDYEKLIAEASESRSAVMTIVEDLDELSETDEVPREESQIAGLVQEEESKTATEESKSSEFNSKRNYRVSWW